MNNLSQAQVQQPAISQSPYELMNKHGMRTVQTIKNKRIREIRWSKNNILRAYSLLTKSAELQAHILFKSNLLHVTRIKIEVEVGVCCHITYLYKIN